MNINSELFLTILTKKNHDNIVYTFNFRDEQSLRIIEKVKHISLAIKKKGKRVSLVIIHLRNNSLSRKHCQPTWLQNTRLKHVHLANNFSYTISRVQFIATSCYSVL